MKGFAYEETARILRRLGADDTLVLIGGQALNYWAGRYTDSAIELSKHAPYASKDVDFCGSQESLVRCAARLNGSSKVYTMDHRTAAFGVVQFRDSAGEERWIDVMRCPFGLSTEDVMRTSIPVDVLDDEGQPTGVSFRVMNPVLWASGPANQRSRPREARCGDCGIVNKRETTTAYASSTVWWCRAR